MTNDKLPRNVTLLTRRQLELELIRMRLLVQHSYIHSGYEDCGYIQMSTEEKVLYNRALGRECPHGWV